MRQFCKEFKPLPEFNVTPARVNLAVLTYNALDNTKLFLESVFKNTNIPFNIFIRDNLSSDDTVAWLTEQQKLHSNLFFEAGNANLGVPGGRNRLIELAINHIPDDGFLIFMDNDLEMLGGWAELYLEFFDDNPEVGVAAAHGHDIRLNKDVRLLYPNPTRTSYVDIVSGGFVCWVRKQTLLDVGPFDEELGIFWHEDDDYCVRAISCGYRVAALPHTPVVHHEHQSGVADDGVNIGGSPENQKYLCEKWRKAGLFTRLEHLKHSDPLGQPGFNRRELVEGIYSRGISKNLGGYFIIEPEVSIDLPALGKRTALKVSFSLSSFEENPIQEFPLHCRIVSGEQELWSHTFQSALEEVLAEFEVVLHEAATLNIFCDRCFDSVLAGMTSKGQQRFSLVLSELSIIPVETVDDSNLPQLAPEKHTDKKSEGILWCGPVFNNTDWALVNQEMIRALHAASVNVQVISTEIDHFAVDEIASRPKEEEFWRKVAINRIDAGCCIICIPDGFESESSNFDKYRNRFTDFEKYIGITSVDFNGVRVERVEQLNKLDLIWVASRSELEALTNAGVSTPIEVMPLGVDLDNFKVDQQLDLRSADDTFRFFAPLEWRKRAGWEVVLKAYLRAFSGDSPTALVLYPEGFPLHHSEINKQVISLMETQIAPGGVSPQVKVINSHLPYQSLPSLYQLMDCYVGASTTSSSKCSSLRAAAMGLPQILPRNQAYRELYGEEDARFVETEVVCSSVVQSNVSSKDVDCWQQPIVEKLSAAMLNAFDNRENLRAVAKSNQLRIQQGCGLNKLAEWLSSRLSQSASNSSLVVTNTGGIQRMEVSGPDNSVLLARPLSEVRPVEHDSNGKKTVGIDVRCFWYDGVSSRGIGHYLKNQMPEVIKLRPDWQFVFIGEEPAPISELGAFLSFSNTTYCCADDLSEYQFDLYHITHPLALIIGHDSSFRTAPKGVPLSVQVYDLIPILFRDLHYNQWPADLKFTYDRLLKEIGHKADVAITCSESSKRDLVIHSGIEASKVKAVMGGVIAPNFSPTDSSISQVRQKFGITGPFIMTVGAVDPHKSPVVTYQALTKARLKYPDLRWVLVGSIGQDPGKQGLIDAMNEGRLEGMIFTDYVSREELDSLYASATALFYPSLYEGFGLPPLEAMYRGCPVITTHCGSLKEVIGASALIIEPKDFDTAGSMIIELLENPDLRKQLKQIGPQHAAGFTWSKVAAATVRAWESVLGEEAKQKHDAGENIQAY